MQKRKFSVRDMCYCACFAALMAVCAQIHIPSYGVSITLQTFAIFLALLTLGGFRGSVAVGLYLLLGAFGLPVFSGFRGGFGAFYMESGGFLFGFMLTSLVYWAISAEFTPQKWGKVIAMAVAILPCYLLGIFRMFMFYSVTVEPRTYVLTAVTFLLPDCLKFLLAWYVSKRLKRFVK